MTPKEKARQQAEETVREIGWTGCIVNPDHLYESELVRANHEGLSASISVWYDKNARPDAPPTCEVFNEESSLRVLGVPAPEEVPEFLRRYADVAVRHGDVPPKHRVDLESGEVLSEAEVERLLKTPQEKRNTLGRTLLEEAARLAGYEATVRELAPAGWRLLAVRLTSRCYGGLSDSISAQQWPLFGLRLTLFPEEEHGPLSRTRFHVKILSDARPVWGTLDEGVRVPTADEAWDVYREGHEQRRIEEAQHQAQERDRRRGGR